MKDGGKEQEYSSHSIETGSVKRGAQLLGMTNGKVSRSHVLQDIHARMCGHPQLDVSEVDVDIADGVVHLTGSVVSCDDKRLVEEIAKEAAGVVKVENELHVNIRAV